MYGTISFTSRNDDFTFVSKIFTNKTAQVKIFKISHSISEKDFMLLCQMLPLISVKEIIQISLIE